MRRKNHDPDWILQGQVPPVPGTEEEEDDEYDRHQVRDETN
jgi:hypothetical protein